MSENGKNNFHPRISLSLARLTSSAPLESGVVFSPVENDPSRIRGFLAPVGE
jgi:hypothetical protein